MCEAETSWMQEPLYDAVKGNYGSMSADGFKSNNSNNLNFYHCQAECLSNYSFGHFSTAYNNGSGEIQSTGTSFRTNPERGSQEICIHVSKGKST